MGYAKFDQGQGGAADPHVPRLRSTRRRLDSFRSPDPRRSQLARVPSRTSSHDSFYAQAWLTVHYGHASRTANSASRSSSTSTSSTGCVPLEEAAKTDVRHRPRRHRQATARLFAQDAHDPRARIDLGELPVVTLPEGKPVAETRRAGRRSPTSCSRRASRRIASGHWSSRSRGVNPTSARAAILAARLATARRRLAAFDAAVDSAEHSLLAGGRLVQRRELASVLLASALDLRADEHTQHGGHRARSDARHAMVRRGHRAQQRGHRGAVGLRRRRHAARQGSRSGRAGAARGVQARAGQRRKSPCRWPTSRRRQQKPEAMIPYPQGHDPLFQQPLHERSGLTKPLETDMEQYVVGARSGGSRKPQAARGIRKGCAPNTRRNTASRRRSPKTGPERRGITSSCP